MRLANAASADRLFGETYAEARETFLEAAAEAGAGLVSHVHPDRSGREDETLACDVALLGDPDASRALLLVSGTHGIEGFFGSAAQRAFLTELPPLDDVRVALVHALNPYGFSHYRRGDADNIDLNRNFVDHGRPYPDNPDYDRLADAIVPRALDESGLETANRAIKAYIRDHGALAFQSAVSRGQYRHPHGLCFGGTAPAWSNAVLREVLARELGGVEELVFIDMHTGLGARGEAELIVEARADSEAFRRARAIWGQRVKASHDGESVSPPLFGTIEEAVNEAHPQARIASICLEVGTVSPTATFLALRSDTWLHAYGDPESTEGRAIKGRMREAFAPPDREWRASVLSAASRVIADGLAALRRRGPLAKAG